MLQLMSMWLRIKNFIFYNNGFVVLVLLVVLSSGSVLAANPNVRDGVISSEERLVRVDNSYIRDVNLKNHDFDVEITKVEKDDVNYYVTYKLQTIELVDGAWKKIIKEDILTVNIEQLRGRDLGLYAAKELKELVDYTKSFLTEVQENERKKGNTQKTIEKKYKGLVGRFLKPEELTFAGYNPVIEAPKVVTSESRAELRPERQEVPIKIVIEDIQNDEGNVGEAGNTTPIIPPGQTVGSTPPAATTTDPVPPADTTAPVITLNGALSIETKVGANYVEEGATAMDNIDGNLTNKISVTGQVNTAAVGEYTIVYSVSDQAGNQSSATRQVRVVETTPPPAVVPEPVNEPEVIDTAPSATTTP